jgi:hypothetical protein
VRMVDKTLYSSLRAWHRWGARGVILLLFLLAGCTGPISQQPVPILAPSPTDTPWPTPTPSPTATPLPTTATAVQPAGWTAVNDPHWSGYTFPQGGLTGVRAQWREPQASGSKGDEEFSWIGIGGWATTQDNLIQVGTFGSTIQGAEQHGIWYETVPPNKAQFPYIAVYPGDQIFASIELQTDQPPTWTLLLVDVTTQSTFKMTLSYASARVYANVILEDPNLTKNNGPPYYPLPRFSSVAFSQIQLRYGNDTWLSADAVYALQITMVQSGQVLAQPSPLTNAAFTINRT